MAVDYKIPDQTLEALLNLGAKNRYVKFNVICNEVKKIRQEKGLMAEPSNFKTRVRRSLVNDKSVAAIRGSNQSEKISINIKFPKYLVKPENPIIFNDKGLAKTVDVETNKFKLLVRST